MRWTPRWLNSGAGIWVESIAADWRELVVSLPLRWYNRNAVGTHFGGSLYAMVDPHLMLLLMQLLGLEYTVWDRAVAIEFLRPGRGTVRARIAITDAELAALRQAAAGGAKVLPEFVVEVKDAASEVVARVRKTLYVRRRLSVEGLR